MSSHRQRLDVNWVNCTKVANAIIKRMEDFPDDSLTEAILNFSDSMCELEEMHEDSKVAVQWVGEHHDMLLHTISLKLQMMVFGPFPARRSMYKMKNGIKPCRIK